jgi:5-aminopentanamidase
LYPQILPGCIPPVDLSFPAGYVERHGGRMFRCGSAQFAPVFGDVETNLERISALAARERTDLLVFPELALTGYLFEDRAELLDLAASAGGTAEGRLTQIAGDTGSHLVVGLAERAGDLAFNSAILVGPSGVIGRYRKAHLFDREKLLFEPGDLPLDVWTVGDVRVGMMICFDWIFPEAARTLALRGADVVAHPSNLVLPLCQRVMPSRCIENRLFAITANRWGIERRGDRELAFTGGSGIWDPAGMALATGPEAEDHVAVVEIDPAAARDKYVTPGNHVLDDRRVDLYER